MTLRLVAIGTLLAAGVGRLGATAGPPSAAARSGAPEAAAGSAFARLSKLAAQAQAAGELADAAGHYRKALALKPDWVEGHWALATLLYDQNEFSDARRSFERVVEARPEDGVALALKALCEARLGLYDLALDGLQRARGLGVPNPDVASVAAFQLALLLNRAGSPDAAFDLLRIFAREGLDNPALIEAFGISMLRLPRMPDEIPAEKRDMVMLAGRGGYHMARGRRTAIGRLALEELVSRFPAEPNVHYAFGVYIAPEEPEAALDELRKELAREPGHVAALVQVASVELRRGNHAAALPRAEEAARLAPNVPATRLVLGRALIESGETDRAIAELESGAALAPESPDIQFALARAYQRAGRADDAERARGLFLKLDRAARERDSPPSTGPSGEPPAPEGAPGEPEELTR